ncbi:MAG: polyketide synthase [Bogoriella megaspora]|nr:MAG: polyketide synthase [Bogoriella megaspora]
MAVLESWVGSEHTQNGRHQEPVPFFAKGSYYLDGNSNSINGLAKETEPFPPPSDQELYRLFALSAHSEHSILRSVELLKDYLERHCDVDLNDLSYTLNVRRSNFPWRASFVAQDVKSLVQMLGTEGVPHARALPRVENVFVFTGQGAQWARMGYDLLPFSSVFAKSIKRSDEILQQLGASWSLTEELSRDESTSRLNDSKFGQPASTAVQIALVDLLEVLGIRSSAVIGHSSGETAAAYAVGGITQIAAMRISYHRSFLAKMSKERAIQSGAMLAVGLGADEVQPYVKGRKGLVIACINSPSSTTISGDTDAVSELKIALDSDHVFARKLKVDTAYHSHHMKLVSHDYLERLEILKTSCANPGTSFFSTVTGEGKVDGFSASYWVENLVSPVQFAGALQTLCEKTGDTPLNLIEVGPHKALAGPIRQTLANMQAEGVSYNYIPTLVRGEDCYRSLLVAAADLFRVGRGVDLSAVTSLGLTTTSLPAVIRDLPPYPWNHTTNHWTESRLSKEYRGRRHPHHDLLGSRDLNSPDNQPIWRMVLSVDRLPWLKDHVVDGFVVFPAAGYMTMAIQAISELNKNTRPELVPKGYRLKNVSFKKTLTLPKESRGQETVLALHRSDDESYDFTVSSMSEQGNWQDHCNGKVSTIFTTDVDEIGQTRELEATHASQVHRLRIAEQACVKLVVPEALYAEMSASGNQYGPSFAVNKGARLAPLQSLNRIEIPDIAHIMPSNFLQPHVIHPATLDGIIQTCVPVFQQHSFRGSVMPVYIEDAFISANIATQPSEEFDVVCDLSNTFTLSTNFSTNVFQRDMAGEPQCVLTVEAGEIRVVGESRASELKSGPENVYKLEWGLDISSVTAETLESVISPLQSDEIAISQAEKVDITCILCARYINKAVREMRENNLAVVDDHRVYWWKWLYSFTESDAGKELIRCTGTATTFIGDSTTELEQLTAILGTEGEAIARIGPQLKSILTGETDALTLFLKDELLFRVYHGDECARPNAYIADYVRALTFQRPGMRILEIGAGTGGTTYQVLRACSPTGEDFCAEYVYTDISSGFFETVRTTRLQSWAHLLTFQTLDLDKDPAQQGFETQAYDLVIAANVVHATPQLSRSLSTIRRLLKPGGILGLVELTRTTPFLNMTFGCIEGWWAGVAEGRTESPLQSVEQWDEHLRKAGFSGVDIAAHDLPEPQRHSALLISSALSVRDDEQISNGNTSPGLVPKLPPVRVLSALQDAPTQQDFISQLLQDLTAKGFETSVCSWTDSTVDETCSYIILDPADSLLLTHASSLQFNHITSIMSKASKLYWITFGSDNAGLVPDSALVTGLCRSARNENQKLHCFSIDVQDGLHQHQGHIRLALVEFVASSENTMTGSHAQPLEYEVMLRDGKMRIQRFVPDSNLEKALTGDEESYEAPLRQPDRPLRLQVEKPGLLGSLVFVDADHGELGPDEVEIESYAWGVNFKDVLVALGQMRPSQTMVGESAGIVMRVGNNFAEQFRPGDRVAAMMGTPYANCSRTNGHWIHRIPDGMSFAEGASIPLTFATAYYGLIDCANLRKGQTVLIHAASGALGQAAVKVAQLIGATIFVTVSSNSKRQMLMDSFAVPESHVFSSRTTDFGAGIRRLTSNVGVDVVLNSLSGDVLQASWECVASLGTFVEVGKTDIYRHTKLNMGPFDRNVRFVSVDMVVLAQQRPEHAQSLLKRIFQDLAVGHVSSLQMTTLLISEAEKAFRLMQSRKHIGKVVLTADERSTVSTKVPPLRLRSESTYIIIGGLGGLGKHLCRHLQNRGARHIALFTRQNFDDVSKESMEQDLRGDTESVVKIVTCDVSKQDIVKNVAAEMRKFLPPVKGILHGGMVLSDRTVSQITQTDFDIALQPKYQGTKYLYDTFAADSGLDFFIMLSSLCGVLGTLGQSNYASAGTFQDMFAHAQVSRRQTNFLSLDVPLIRDTYPVTQERISSLNRQGCQLVDLEAVLPIIDYAISGRAFRDRCHQIAFGLDAEGAAQTGGARGCPPLFAKIVGTQNKRAVRGGRNAAETKTVEEAVMEAQDMPAAELLILDALRRKVASLTALDLSDQGQMDLDTPIASMGLDSLVATEMKNWIKNSLQAAVQTTDIVDAPSLRSLAALVTQNSGLVRVKNVAEQNQSDIGEQMKHLADTRITNANLNGNSLPEYPVQPLETVLNTFIDDVSHLGSNEELAHTRTAIADFLANDGVGSRLQARLEESDKDARTEEGGVIDMYVRNKWLRGRDWRPRLRNFFATLSLGNESESTGFQVQAERAASLALAAYGYKMALDAGTVEQDYQHDQALCMDTVYWLFNSNRTPVLECDNADRWPGNEYLVVMRRGEAYKVPLRGDDTEVISHQKLRNVVQDILEQDLPAEMNPACILTTGDRDDWAKVRKEIIAYSPSNSGFISAIEKSLFLVLLDDVSPTSAEERAKCFLLDDNSNRWLDKTLSFVVCANGVAAMFCEHTMVDGTTFDGLIKALSAPPNPVRQEESKALGAPRGKMVQNGVSHNTKEYFSHLPFTLPTHLYPVAMEWRAAHLAAHEGYTLTNYDLIAFGAQWLRTHKLPPKSAVQLIVQLAVRLYFGYSPSSVDVISQRPFQGGRTDMIYITTAEIKEFCDAAAVSSSSPVTPTKKLFLDAVKAHARLVALSQRGRGWRWHLMALREVLAPGEELPALYRDPVYLRTGDRPVCTSFTEFGLPEMGRCQPKKTDVWFGVQVFEESVRFTVIHGEGKSAEFVKRLSEAAGTIREIIAVTGTLFATQTVFPREAIKIVRGEDKLGKYSDYGRDGDSYHAFCSKCGSPMMCGVQNDKMAIVRLGLIDAEDDERMQRIMDGLGEGGEAQKDGKSLFEPTDEIFCKRKIAWAKDWKVEGAKQWREMDG